MSTDSSQYGQITEEAMADLRTRLGTEISPRPQPYLTEASRDAIRHWAQAIGDRNPLWVDPDYAAGTRWKGIVSPPTILSAFDKLSGGYRGGLPGVHSFFGGIDWRWHAPIRAGDHIDTSIVFSDLREKSSRFARRMLQQVSDVKFTNQDGVVVCDGESWGMRTERASGKKTGKYRKLEPKVYTDEEIEAVFEAYDNEYIRGSETLFWEDVEVGTSLPAVPKGPYTPTNAVAFEMARGGLFVMAHGFWYDYLKRHPALAIPNDQNVPESPETVHWDSEMARRVGAPAAYDYGPERIAWLAQVVTNWSGDDGWLRNLKVKIRRFNFVGDMTWCHGRVTGKRNDGDLALVDCELWCEDHRGETTADGEAVVVLPRRADAAGA